ncbi:MAG: glucose-6-phosphate 1-dehydrogenase [Actinomycetota bacterium]|jgi:glucose-6-phosphate 1-dehydrogenase|nr:glucose-6-phosphate 1-dehydrogenase [Actinomycetota bacterium]
MTVEWRKTPDDHVIVVLGATGDLARKKLLPALFHLDMEDLMPKRYLVVATSKDEVTDDQFREFARDAVDEFCRCKSSEGHWDEFAARLSYVSGEFGPDDDGPLGDAIRKAEAEIGGDPPRRLFYLAVPPQAFGPITLGIGAAELAERARVIYEKPFGWDMESFIKLNNTVHEVLTEDQIYRIDHFLGKETVQNILAFRFANGMFEPIWNRDHIDHVQIDVPEDIGIGARGGFYEKTGAFRDMIVTHLFQVLSFIAMEPPSSFGEQPLLDEKSKVFESMVALEPDDVVFGQYEGYQREEGVAPDSRTETFAAARVWVDNWRWSGMPFFLRTGKRMAEKRWAVTLAFREPPKQMFEEVEVQGQSRNHLTMEMGPNEGISVSFLAKVPGPSIELGPARMDFRYASSFGSELIEAYERLIHDALIGDRTLFTRCDGIERVWELVEKLIHHSPAVHEYPQGSWGPQAANELIAPRQWHLPEPPTNE